MKYEAHLSGKPALIVEAPSEWEAQKIATKLFKTKRTVYVCHIDEEKGFTQGVQPACMNSD